MRDLLVVAIVMTGALAALRRPWIGVLLWTWLSLMSPHRYTYGFAYDAPLAAIAAGVTMLGMLFDPGKQSPFKGVPVVLFAVFTVWITVSWLMGLGVEADYAQWSKVMKINLMIFVALSLLRTREHIVALAWVCALSLALLGSKGGVFTLLGGGHARVYGPPGSFVEDNNEFALALVVTIPLLRFLQLQLTSSWSRHFITMIMVLCGVAALGSHSRGGLLAIVAMTSFLWWRGRNRFWGGIVLVAVGAALVSFMPESWTDRMGTIEHYESDRSALGRLSAWTVSWRVALEYPFGAGFNITRPEFFLKYSPNPELGTPVAHSIYFQVLGHHGFVGFAIFLSIWIFTWRAADQLRKDASSISEAKWCSDLGALSQVSLVGYLVGGAFLSLAYFDLPYYVMALVVLARNWVRGEGWKLEIDRAPRWKIALGLASVRTSRVPNVAPRTVVRRDAYKV